MEIRENSQKKVLLSVLGVAILVVAVIGISFAAYSATRYSAENTISTGTLMVSYQEDSNAINITNAMPLSDDLGKAMTEDTEMFTFSVSTKATDAISVPYTISLTPSAGNTLTNAQIKAYLTKDGTAIGAPKLVNQYTAITQGTRNGSYLLYSATDTFTSGNSATKDTTYVLKLWVDSNVDLSSATESYTYSATVNVDSNVTPIA